MKEIIAAIIGTVAFTIWTFTSDPRTETTAKAVGVVCLYVASRKTNV